jgi:hypothetical protein
MSTVKSTDDPAMDGSCICNRQRGLVICKQCAYETGLVTPIRSSFHVFCRRSHTNAVRTTSESSIADGYARVSKMSIEYADRVSIVVCLIPILIFLPKCLDPCSYMQIYRAFCDSVNIASLIAGLSFAG